MNNTILKKDDLVVNSQAWERLPTYNIMEKGSAHCKAIYIYHDPVYTLKFVYP